MSQRLLVTGGSGFVGKAVIENALQRGMKVNVSSRQRPKLTHPCIKHFFANNIDLSTNWKEELKNIQYVVHCAGRAHVNNEKVPDSLALFRKVNVDGTLNLARQAAESGVKRFVFISSIGVNGAKTTNNFPFRESDDPKPQSAYAISKWEAEKGLFDISIATGMEVVVIRPPLIYGSDAPGNFGLLMRIILSGWPMPLGGIKNSRSFVAINALVDFIFTCIFHPNAKNQIFLVSDDHDVSTSDFLISLSRAAGVKKNIFSVPLWLLKLGAFLVGKINLAQNLCESLQIDISKAKNTLGWSPPNSFSQEIDLTIRKSIGK
jgi:nucleoside-diphosphate-sugar epimerase